jgi:hypothetical protein
MLLAAETKKWGKVVKFALPSRTEQWREFHDIPTTGGNVEQKRVTHGCFRSDRVAHRLPLVPGHAG